MISKNKVMVIDDSEEILFLLETILNSNDIDVVPMSSPTQAFKTIDRSIDCIILDLMMPEMSGEDFLIHFRELNDFQHIPIILLTAKSNEDTEVGRLLTLGANDYLTKPIKTSEFLARINNHIQLKQATEMQKKMNNKLKSQNRALLRSISREEKLTEKVIERTLKLKKAIRKIKKLNRKLKFSSSHDALTNIYNRGAIMNFLNNDVLRTKRFDTHLSIVMLDIDYFKKVNDEHGHIVGDQVLIQLTEVVKENIREIDLLGRYGGEEFLLILPDTEKEEASVLCERVLKKVRSHKFKTNKGELKKTVSLGITNYKNGETIDSFIERADSALYEAKESGRDCIKIK